MRAVLGAVVAVVVLVFAAAVAVPPPGPSADPVPVTPAGLEERATVVIEPAVPVTVPSRGSTSQATPTLPPPTTSTVSTLSVPATARCPQWWDEAVVAGWPEWTLPHLDYVMWRESRCLPTAHNPRPPDDSYGLVQLNMRAHRSWVGPLVDGDFTRLFDPTTNLRTARRLFDMAQQAYGCGWQPWQTSGWSPC